MVLTPKLLRRVAAAGEVGEVLVQLKRRSHPDAHSDCTGLVLDWPWRSPNPIALESGPRITQFTARQAVSCWESASSR